jgi:3D-(3,5/4)-trihydroxycyclohexane-1,2-dione acylhydrolase (decyclizing)
MKKKSCRLTTGQALVRYLGRQYVERDGRQNRFIEGICGIFGHGNVAGLGQGIVEVRQAEGLRFYKPQHEQAMVHTAAAFAKHRNRLATFACTTSIGPGAANMITGAAGATVNRIPVLLLPSDYFANRVPDPVLQQLEHTIERDVSVNDAFRPVSKFFDRISRPEQLLASLHEAFRVLTDPADTGAVTICLPEDVQADAWDWPEEFFEQRIRHVRRPVPEPELVSEVMKLLKAARRPLIISGGGTIYSEASGELDRFIDRFGIPIVETQAGKGVLTWNHSLNAGPIGSNGATSANRLARDADLVVALGTRLSDFTTASKSAFQNPTVRFVGINVAPMDASKLAALPVVADAKRALTTLSSALNEAGYRGTDPSYRDEIKNLKAEWDAKVTDHKSGQLTGDYIPVDLVKHAESMGAHAIFAQTPEEITAAVLKARETAGVTVIVIPADPEKRMPGMGKWWDVPVAEVSAEEITRQTREKYEKATALQRPVFAG